MDYLRLLGQRIKTRRVSLGMSQETLASMVGINRGHLSDLEQGKWNVTIMNLMKISKGLSISLSELLKDM